jgi:glycerol-3-phosphate dehydrogenase
VIEARVVVNAAGAWASRFPVSQVKLRLTKGVHLVVDRSRLPVDEAVVMTEGSRILFAIPWGERLILGTTDTDYDGETESPDCTEEDVAYVLKITNQTFPVAKLSRGDVISAWSGLRPLIADPNGKPSDISRAHQILSGAPGWIDVAGGKLTTYRLMAEQTVDRIVKFLGRTTPPCRTAGEAILSEKERDFSALVPVGVTREAVEHYCTAEWARHLDDVMIRRTGWRFYHRDQAEIAERVAGWMGEVLGWSEERRSSEMERYERMTRGLAVSWEAPVGEENPGGANEGEAEGVVDALSS